MNLTSSFRINLRQLLSEKGWSNSELARRSGLGESSVRAVLSSDHSPKLSTVQSLADGLDVSVSTLIGTEQKQVDPELLSKIVEHIFNRLREIHSSDIPEQSKAFSSAIANAYQCATDLALKPSDEKQIKALTELAIKTMFL